MKELLKFNRMTTSTRTQQNLGALRVKTGLAPNVLLRFALCMSLRDPSIPNPDEFNQGGTEIMPTAVFGEYEKIYLALMLNRLKKDRLDPETHLDKMTLAHLNRGVIALFPRVQDLADFYKMI